MDKTLKGIHGVQFDNQKVLQILEPNILSVFFSSLNKLDIREFLLPF